MIEINQINCNEATYVDKRYSSTNFSKGSTLVTGIITNRSSVLNIYKVILNFTMPDIKPDMVKSAYLFLFVENIKFYGSSYEGIGICGNYEHSNIGSLNWNTFPNEGFTEMLHLTLPKNSNGSYVKINITAIIKDLSKYDINYNLIFAPVSANSNIIIKFCSCYSNNPPYIKLELTKENNAEDHYNDDNELKDTLKYIDNNSKKDGIQYIKSDSGDTVNYNAVSNNDFPGSNDDSIPKDDKSEESNENSFNTGYRSLNIHNEKVLDIPTLFTEILTTLTYQSELLDKLKNSNSTDIYDNMFSSISDEIQKFSEEFSVMQQDLYTKSAERDIELTDTIVEKISQKIDLQNSVLDSIKNSTSKSCSIDDLNKTNDIIVTLSNNLESLYSVINEIKEISSAKSSSEEITALNSLVTLIVSTLDMQSSEISSIKESTDNIATKNDINTVSASVTDINANFNNVSSSLDNLRELLMSTCSLQDLKETNSSISDLSDNIDSLYELLDSIKEFNSKIPTTDNINAINDLIVDLKNTFDTESSNIETIQRNIANVLSKDDIENTNNLIMNLNEEITQQGRSLDAVIALLSNLMQNTVSLDTFQETMKNTTGDINKLIDNMTLSIQNLEVINNKIDNAAKSEDIESLKNTIDLAKKDNESQLSALNSHNSDLMDEIKKSSSLLLSLKNTESSKLTRNDIEEIVTEVVKSSLLSQNEILTDIGDNLSNICSTDNFSSINETLINVTQLLNNSNLKYEYVENTNETYYKSISDSLEDLNNKLSHFENLNSKLDLFQNNSVVLSQNFLDLNHEIKTLKGIVIPISESLDSLKLDFNNLKDTITNSNSVKKDTSNSDNTAKLNHINEKLSILENNLQKVIDIISSITIEPLN